MVLLGDPITYYKKAPKYFGVFISESPSKPVVFYISSMWGVFYLSRWVLVLDTNPLHSVTHLNSSGFMETLDTPLPPSLPSQPACVQSPSKLHHGGPTKPSVPQAGARSFTFPAVEVLLFTPQCGLHFLSENFPRNLRQEKLLVQTSHMVPNWSTSTCVYSDFLFAGTCLEAHWD